MDEYNIYEGAFSGPQIDNILANSTRQDAIAIVSNNNTHIAITAGQYVYVKGHGTLAEGMYKANSNIAANGTLTSSNLTAVSNGVANELKSALKNVESFSLNLASGVTAAGTCFYEPTTGKVSINVALYGVFSSSPGYRIASIPSKYYPSVNYEGPCFIQNSSTKDTWFTYCAINPYGNIEQGSMFFDGTSTYAVDIWFEYYI